MQKMRIVKNIMDISEECEDCFKRLREYNEKEDEDAVPSCIAYENEPWHYSRMIDENECPYLYARLSWIFEDNLPDVKRFWKKEVSKRGKKNEFKNRNTSENKKF